MKKTELDARDASIVNYTERMSEAQKARNALNQGLSRKPVMPQGMVKGSPEYHEWIVSMQPASTRAIIQRDPSKDAEHFNRVTDPKAAQVVGSGEDMVSQAEQRLASYGQAQINHVEAIRRRPKNSLGQSVKSSVSEERRESAIHHFEVSGRAKITNDAEQQIVKEYKVTESVPEETPKEVWVPLTFWQAIKHWCKGGKVQRATSDDQTHWGTWRVE